MNLLEAMTAWESGELDEESTINLFQDLVDSGQAWTLQGTYGRTASGLIEAGLVVDASDYTTPPCGTVNAHENGCCPCDGA